MVRGFDADDFAEGASANVTDVFRSRSAASPPSAERTDVGEDAPPDRSLASCEIRFESGRRSDTAFAVCWASSVAASCASAAAAASAAATNSSSESLLSKAGGSAPSADVPAPSAKVETLPDESFDVTREAFGVEPRFAPTKDDFERSSTPAAASSAARGVEDRKLFDREALPSSAAAASAAAVAVGASGARGVALGVAGAETAAAHAGATAHMEPRLRRPCCPARAYCSPAGETSSRS